MYVCVEGERKRRGQTSTPKRWIAVSTTMQPQQLHTEPRVFLGTHGYNVAKCPRRLVALCGLLLRLISGCGGGC